MSQDYTSTPTFVGRNRVEAFWQDARVTFIKCDTADAFVVVDLPEAEVATGVVRVARKLLVDGAWNLARVLTYAAASFDLKVSGASVGINAEGDGRNAAVSAAISELASRTTPPTLLLDAGKGLRPDELAPLAASDTRSGDRSASGLLASGVVAAAAAVAPLAGRTVCIEKLLAADLGLAEAFTAAGATLVDDAGLTTECDVLVVGSKPGLIDHELAAALRTQVVVPAGPLPVTARGLAFAVRAGIVVLPDFVTTAAPLIAGLDPDGGDPAARIAAVIAEVADHPEGHLLGACERAEKFLTVWASIPFGRPLP